MTSTPRALEERDDYFQHGTKKAGGVIMPEERLPCSRTLVFGAQHVIAIAGGTIVTPLLAVGTPGISRRLPIIIGAIVGYVPYLLLSNGLGWSKAIDYGGLAAKTWFGLPNFETPSFHADKMLLIAPTAIMLVAENLWHIKAVAR